MISPRDLALGAEAAPRLPEGAGERFSGYGIMGLPFRSGHVLALRRFPASSIGPAYSSVWHRAPTGQWTFYQDVTPDLACPRYFGPALARTLQRPIDVKWMSPTRLSVRVDHGR
ncbi:MAG TPA: hypothetical protein VEM76_15575, partial [Anaeromyxobacteraceae bacterium]|nr:hypothetical protein [Anaeromyxobacteraceae bacterium]